MNLRRRVGAVPRTDDAPAGRRTVPSVATSRGPGQRAGLTRGAVLAAARDLLATGGVDALTMRALARALDVAPNALYSHVESKTQLLDELLDDLLAAVESSEDDTGDDTGDPVAGLVLLLGSTYAVLTAHPDLVPLFLARQGARGPNAVRLGEVMDGLLVRAGVAGDVEEARRVLVVHTIGSAAFATGAPVAPDADRPIPAQVSERTFVRSIRWLLDGIVPSRSPSR